MITKLQICMTMILLARTVRDNQEQTDSAKETYMNTLKHLTQMHGLTPKDMEMATLKLLEMQGHKPTVKMGKVITMKDHQTKATVPAMKRVRPNLSETRYSMKDPA